MIKSDLKKKKKNPAAQDLTRVNQFTSSKLQYMLRGVMWQNDKQPFLLLQTVFVFFDEWIKIF